MSQLPKNQPLPNEWVERLFARFTMYFGVQKVGAMWAGVDDAEVKAEWAAQLGRFPVPTLRAAMQAVVDSGKEWPPTLPEFVAICRDFYRPEGGPNLALVAPGQGYTDNEQAKANLARIKEMLRPVVERQPGED